MKFTIRKKHYDSAVRELEEHEGYGIASRCLIAQALRDAYRVNEATCAPTTATLYFPGDMQTKELSKVLQQLIKDFDSNGKALRKRLPIRVELPWSKKEIETFNSVTRWRG